METGSRPETISSSSGGLSEVREIQARVESLELGRETTPVEQSEALVEEKENKKRHLNVVFIGHVDAGKSTTGGQILFLSGQVDDRTIQRYEREAQERNRESWYMAYIMDTNEEERLRGKTVEVGRAHFETETTRFTILDAPGHKSYVPNMISGASQADIGVLVISARKGEFEAGYEGGGQTREHVLLAKTLGIAKLVVVINKMDDPTFNWSKIRYDEIVEKLEMLLEDSKSTYISDGRKDAQFLPISGLVGSNIKTRLGRNICDWYSGPCLFEILDTIEVPLRDPNGPVRMPIIDKYKDMGTIVMGKIESGTIRKGDSLVAMPNRANVKVVSIYCDENEVREVGPSENVRVKLSGVEEEDILSGFVLSSAANPVGAYYEFQALLHILELPDNKKSIITAGYKAVLHSHSIAEECEIIELIEEIEHPKKKKGGDPKKKKKPKRKPLFLKNDSAALCRIQVSNLICIESFSDFPQLGRFTLRTEGKTVALGKVMRVPPAGRSNFAA